MSALRFSKATLVKVTAFAAISATFTVGLGLKIGNLRLFAHQYRLEAVFSDASGVFKGDAVKLAGVDVGHVVGAKIENGRATVTFTVDNSVRLARDSVAAIRWRNVLGQRFLYVYPGSDRGEPLQDGDVIPLSQTENAGDLGQFLNELGPILKAIDPAKANAFLDAMNTALAGNEPAIRQLLADGAFLAGRLGQTDDRVQSLISSSDKVMAAYASQQQAIRSILDDLNVLGDRLDGMTGDIDSLVVNFADVQHQLDTLLRENKGNIDSTLSNLDSVAANLVANRKQLAQTLCTLPAGVTGYFQTTSWGEWFNVRIVEVVLKDREGNTVVAVPEADQEHPQSQPPFTCGAGGANAAVGSGSSGNAPSGGGKGGTPTQTVTHASESIEQFVRFVLGGSSRG